MSFATSSSSSTAAPQAAEILRSPRYGSATPRNVLKDSDVVALLSPSTANHHPVRRTSPTKMRSFSSNNYSMKLFCAWLLLLLLAPVSAQVYPFNDVVVPAARSLHVLYGFYVFSKKDTPSGQQNAELIWRGLKRTQAAPELEHYKGVQLSLMRFEDFLVRFGGAREGTDVQSWGGGGEFQFLYGRDARRLIVLHDGLCIHLPVAIYPYPPIRTHLPVPKCGYTHLPVPRCGYTHLPVSPGTGIPTYLPIHPPIHPPTHPLNPPPPHPPTHLLNGRPLK